ncbi:ComEC/Rec2 family competence protein [Alkaliphilus peptidifermentans]|uniref:Competence protein ComEC n=1 Tax=Alkaliphilus peptidifermentans DSM 18978 TaxID=1120976 RepID=A0A1G5BYV6_9FIRM|nr:ComEC/Rec2 family competence protein [Alkaliphilus peptidifermentans]SCX95375.1 competence protein ComEC [Alkaliphilus peptidifermentans DSM 18978]
MNNKLLKISSIIVVLLFLLTGCRQESRDSYLNVHVIDVGQGDSILITTPEGKSILIDGGEAKYSKNVIGYLKRENVSKIDLLIATHPHADHIGGLIDVIEAFEIKEIIMPPISHTSKTFENLLITIQNKELQITPATAGLQYLIQEDLNFIILGPIYDYGADLNNWSVIAKLDYKEKSFLFTGDIEYKAEMDLINYYDKSYLKSHFLKVSHHGSSTSTHKDFLQIIAPDVAVISLGNNNPYGFPHSEVLERLNANRILIYRTDIQGTLVFTSDGYEIWTNQKPSNYN